MVPTARTYLSLTCYNGRVTHGCTPEPPPCSAWSIHFGHCLLQRVKARSSIPSRIFFAPSGRGCLRKAKLFCSICPLSLTLSTRATCAP